MARGSPGHACFTPGKGRPRVQPKGPESASCVGSWGALFWCKKYLFFSPARGRKRLFKNHELRTAYPSLPEPFPSRWVRISRPGSDWRRKPRIQMRKPVMGGKPPRDRAFARSGRTVDGDDHPQRFPGRIARDRLLNPAARLSSARHAATKGKMAAPLCVG